LITAFEAAATYEWSGNDVMFKNVDGKEVLHLVKV